MMAGELITRSFNLALRWKYASEEWSTTLGVVTPQLFSLNLPSKICQTYTSPLLPWSV